MEICLVPDFIKGKLWVSSVVEHPVVWSQWFTMMWFLGHNGVDSMNLWVMVWYGIAQHNTVWYAVTAAALARAPPAQETLGEGLALL